MASWLSRIITFVRGVFKSKPAQVFPGEWRPATKTELKTLGLSLTSRRYIPKGPKKVTKRTPTISVRSYQQAQQGKTIEARREAYATGKIPRKYPARYGVRFKRFPGKIAYENIPWNEVPNYFRRAKKYQHMQVSVLGKRPEGGGRYEDIGDGLVWQTIFSDGANELPILYRDINSGQGFRGFSQENQPVFATLTFWKTRR